MAPLARGGKLMTKANRAGDTPIAVEVSANQRYWWCSCGLSKSQPFCDGSHKGSDFKPVEYVATEDKRLFFCTCKATQSAPFCDGSHKDHQ